MIMVYRLVIKLTLVLDSEMASLIALEFEFEPQVDESAGFDLYPQYDPRCLF